MREGAGGGGTGATHASVGRLQVLDHLDHPRHEGLFLLVAVENEFVNSLRVCRYSDSSLPHLSKDSLAFNYNSYHSYPPTHLVPYRIQGPPVTSDASIGLYYSGTLTPCHLAGPQTTHLTRKAVQNARSRRRRFVGGWHSLAGNSLAKF